MAVEHLETKGFTDATNTFQQSVQTYNGIKSAVQSITAQLLQCWEGEGRVQFEKDYQLVFRQLGDIGDVLYELYDALVDAQAAYIKTDEELSKQFTV